MDGCLPMAIMMLEHMSLLENKLSVELLYSTISLSQESLPIHQNTKSPACLEPVEGHKKVPAATKKAITKVCRGGEKG